MEEEGEVTEEDTVVRRRRPTDDAADCEEGDLDEDKETGSVRR